MRIPYGLLAEAAPGPLKVYFEVTNRCNFRCAFCPIQSSRREERLMDYELLCKGIEETARDRIADCVGFHVLGEPLLYPRLCDAVRLAKGCGLRTELTTNGSLLTPARLASLIESGLDSLTISLQVDESEHASRGSGLPFERYYQGVLEVVRLAARAGRPEIVLCAMDTSTRWLFDIDTSMGFSQNRTDYRLKLRRFVRDTCAAAGLAEPPGELTRRLSIGQPKLVRVSDQVAIYAQPFADWGNAFTQRNIHRACFGACGYALQNIGILSNGEVAICCADYDGHTSLGNLRSSSLKRLLSSEKAAAIRKGFERWRPKDPYCRRCLGATSRLGAALKGIASIYLFGLKGFQPARATSVRATD